MAHAHRPRGGPKATVDGLALDHAPHLRRAVEAHAPLDPVGVVLDANLPAATSTAAFQHAPQLRVLRSGVAVGVVDRVAARELASALGAARVHEALAAPPAAGFLHVLVLTAAGPGLVPMAWATAKGGQA